MKNIANIITTSRIVCSIALVFCTALSPAFYTLYVVAGVTDMVDGTVARRTGSASEFGSRLDTVADMIFVGVCLFKLLPVLDLTAWMYVWIGVIAAIKVVNIISGYVKGLGFVSVHTTMNKVTGLLLFALPLTLGMIELKYSAVILCVVATFAAIQEGHYIRNGQVLTETGNVNVDTRF